MNTETTKKRGRPKSTSTPTNDRFTFQVPNEYKDIINGYKYPQETYVDFIKRCIIYTCSAMDVKKTFRLTDMLSETEKTELNSLTKAIQNVTESLSDKGKLSR